MKVPVLAAVLAAVVLTLISVGCATFPAERFVSVETTSSVSDGSITPAIAVDLFHTIVNTLGLIEKNPKQDPRTPDFYEYSAETSGTDQANPMRFHLMVNKNSIEFISTVYGDQKDLVRAERIAALIERAFNERGVKYKIRKGRDPVFWGA